MNGCCGGFGYAIPGPKRKQLNDLLKRKKFHLMTLEEGNFTVCTCETTNVVFLESPNVP